MSSLQLALVGGALSLIATMVGVFSYYFLAKFEGTPFANLHLSLDFALGVIISAAAFSLILPHLQNAAESNQLELALGAVALGALAIGIIHRVSDQMTDSSSSRLALVIVLIAHNIPEGMGSGASMAALDLVRIYSIQGGLVTQNLVEGWLLVTLLRSMGFSLPAATSWGLFSGLVEFLGAASAGLAITISQNLAPTLLAMAGGAMLMSVGIETLHRLRNGEKPQWHLLALGLLIIPITQALA